MKNKKKFKETKVGGFIFDNFPKIKAVIGNAIPDSGIMGMVKNLIIKDKGVDQETKDKALEMLYQFEIAEMQEVTKRHDNDMKSDSWLSKNVRPLTLMYLLATFTFLAVIDTLWKTIVVRDIWINQFGGMCFSALAFYFGLREFGKWQERKNKNRKL